MKKFFSNIQLDRKKADQVIISYVRLKHGFIFYLLEFIREMTISATKVGKYSVMIQVYFIVEVVHVYQI